MNNVRATPNAGGVAHRLCDSIEELLRHHGIGVNENQSIAVRAPSANVSNPCDVVDLLMHDCCTEGPRNICGAIHTRIIDNDQFHTTPARSDRVPKAGQRFGKVPFLVESRDNDAQQHTALVLSITETNVGGKGSSPNPLA